MGWCPETEVRDVRQGWPGGSANQPRPRLQRDPSAFHLYCRNNTHPPSPFQTDRHRLPTFSTNDADTPVFSRCFSTAARHPVLPATVPGTATRWFSQGSIAKYSVHAIALAAIDSYLQAQGRQAVHEPADRSVDARNRPSLRLRSFSLLSRFLNHLRSPHAGTPGKDHRSTSNPGLTQRLDPAQRAKIKSTAPPVPRMFGMYAQPSPLVKRPDRLLVPSGWGFCFGGHA